jgi:hypothetical protein
VQSKGWKAAGRARDNLFNRDLPDQPPRRSVFRFPFPRFPFPVLDVSFFAGHKVSGVSRNSFRRPETSATAAIFQPLAARMPVRRQSTGHQLQPQFHRAAKRMKPGGWAAIQETSSPRRSTTFHDVTSLVFNDRRPNVRAGMQSLARKQIQEM